MELFFEAAFNEKSQQLERFLADYTFVEEPMLCVDSKWDKKIIRALLSVSKSRKDKKKLGMDSERVVKNIIRGEASYQRTHRNKAASRGSSEGKTL